MKKYLVHAPALLLLLVVSCYYDNKEDLYKDLPSPVCDTVDVSYSAFVKPLLERSCATPNCHIGPNASAGIDLSLYADAKRIADNGSFYGRITNTTGPLMPQGGPRLPPCDIDKIEAWIDAGALNN